MYLQSKVRQEKTIQNDENLKQANYVPKTLQTEALMEVKAGTADAAVLDLTLAKTMTGEGTNYEDIVIVDYLAEEIMGLPSEKVPIYARKLTRSLMNS